MQRTTGLIHLSYLCKMIDIYMTHDLHQRLKHILHRDSEKPGDFVWIVENHHEEVFISRAKASWKPIHCIKEEPQQ